MKIAIRINGAISIELIPQDEIEKLVIAQVLAAAGKGQAINIKPTEDGPTANGGGLLMAVPKQ